MPSTKAKPDDPIDLCEHYESFADFAFTPQAIERYKRRDALMNHRRNGLPRRNKYRWILCAA